MKVEDLEDLYQKVQDYEKSNKDAILLFEEKYPDVLNNNNFNSIFKKDSESNILNTLETLIDDMDK